MPRNDDGKYFWKTYTDAHDLTHAMQSSYDHRVHVARGFILYNAHLKEELLEERLRKQSPGLQDAWDQYKTLLGLVKEN